MEMSKLQRKKKTIDKSDVDVNNKPIRIAKKSSTSIGFVWIGNSFSEFMWANVVVTHHRPRLIGVIAIWMEIHWTWSLCLSLPQIVRFILWLVIIIIYQKMDESEWMRGNKKNIASSSQSDDWSKIWWKKKQQCSLLERNAETDAVQQDCFNLNGKTVRFDYIWNSLSAMLLFVCKSYTGAIEKFIQFQ